MKYATKHDLKPIARAYCDRVGAKFLFVSDDCTTLGFEMRGGQLVHITFEQLARDLGIIGEDESFPDA